MNNAKHLNLVSELDNLAERAYDEGYEELAFIVRFASEHARAGRADVLTDMISKSHNVSWKNFNSQYFKKGAKNG